MSSKRQLWAHTVLLRSQDTIGRQEGTIPKNRMGKTKRDRQSRKPGLAEVIPLPLPRQAGPHRECPGCQLCICARLELEVGGKWEFNGQGVPERIEE